MTDEKRLARIAGSLYLVVAVLGGFAELVVRSSIIEPGDATATAENIRSSATLFRLGFVADLVQATLFLFTAMALYLLLRHVNELVARAMVVLVAISVAIISLNLLNQYMALSIATGAGYARTFGPVGSDRLTLLFVDLHHNGYLIAQMFFGLWLVPLGYLVVRSGFFPKVLGVLLALGGVAYVVDLLVHFLAPGVAETISPYVLIPVYSEVLFVIYLLVKGVRDPQDRSPRAGRDQPVPARS
jgi:Domain of unknown function (DUF4386)